MSDQEPGRVFYPSEDQDIDENMLTGSRDTINYGFTPISDQLWLQDAPTFSSTSIEEAHEAPCYSNILNDLSNFDVPSSLPLQQANPSEIPSLEKITQLGLEKGQSSGAKRKHASDLLGTQTKESNDEDGVEEVLETSGKCKQRTRSSYREAYNLAQRLRRQKFKEKINAFQEMIPNCNKCDVASILDDAIMYINTLRYQVQVMSLRLREGFSMLHPPFMMIPQSGQQGMLMPSPAPFLYPPSGGSSTGMEYGIGMGMSGMFSPFNFAMSQLGLPNPFLLTSLATSGLPAAYSIQNPGNYVLEPFSSTTSSKELAPLSATSSRFRSTTGGDQTGPSITRWTK